MRKLFLTIHLYEDTENLSKMLIIVTSFFSVSISSKRDGLKPRSALPCPSDEPCSPLFGDTLGLLDSDF